MANPLDVSVDEFVDELLDDWDRRCAPGAFHSESGDCAFFFAEPGNYYAERIDALLTVYRALAGDRILGVQIKGLSQLPEHDRMTVRWRSCDGPRQERDDVIQLLLETFRKQPTADTQAYTATIKALLESTEEASSDANGETCTA